MLYSLQKSRTSCFVILIITTAVAKSEHFSYHVVFLDVSAHGNVQLVGNCSCAVLTVTSWTCIVDFQCVRLQKKFAQSINLRPKSLYVIVWRSHFSSCVWSIFVPYLTKRIKFELGIALCFLKFCHYELECISKNVVHLWVFNYSNLVMCFVVCFN